MRISLRAVTSFLIGMQNVGLYGAVDCETLFDEKPFLISLWK